MELSSAALANSAGKKQREKVMKTGRAMVGNELRADLNEEERTKRMKRQDN